MNLFKRKSKKEKLLGRYKKLLQQAHELSTLNRTMSDAKMAEAEEINQQIQALE